MIEQLAQPWGELALYQTYGNLMRSGPFFEAEYPVFALRLFQLANIFGEKWFTLTWYGMVAICILIVALLVRKLRGNPYIFLAAILPLGGLLWDRFDIFPAMLSLLAVYLATNKKSIFIRLLAFFVLGLAILLKIYPIILLPVLMGMMFKRRYVEEMFLGFLIVIIMIGSVSWDCLSFHKDRGIQIESIRAIPKLLNKNSIVEFKHNTFEIR